MSEAETVQQTTLSFGKRFSTARGALNLSREDVAKELRLGVDVITALEDEDYEHLAVPIFVTGYIRNYARLLKIPVEPLLAAYNQVQLEAPTIVAKGIRKSGASYNQLIIKAASVLIILVLIAGIFSWFQSQNFEPSTWFSSQAESKSAEPEISLPKLVEPDPLPTKSGDESEVSIRIEAKELVPLELENEIASKQEIASTPAPEVVIATKVVDPAPSQTVARNELILTLSSDSWIDIQDSAGKRLIYDLLRVGKTRRVSGVPPFKVFLGNAKGVKIKYNGQLIDIEQHTRGNLARFKISAAGE